MEIFCIKIAGETNQFVDFQFVGDKMGVSLILDFNSNFPPPPEPFESPT